MYVIIGIVKDSVFESGERLRDLDYKTAKRVLRQLNRNLERMSKGERINKTKSPRLHTFTN